MYMYITSVSMFHAWCSLLSSWTCSTVVVLLTENEVSSAGIYNLSCWFYIGTTFHHFILYAFLSLQVAVRFVYLALASGVAGFLRKYQKYHFCYRSSLEVHNPILSSGVNFSHVIHICLAHGYLRSFLQNKCVLHLFRTLHI